MKPNYAHFFERLTGSPRPYLWQCRLACGDPPEGANCNLENPDTATTHWLSQSKPQGCQSRLIDIPTGLGKTAGVILAWLWNRLRSQSVTPNKEEQNTTHWPRRLVYCLPMRTLVEQTEGEVEKWLINLWEHREELGLENNPDLHWLLGQSENIPTPGSQIPASNPKLPSPIILMGGEDLAPEKRDWDLYPERPAILIGTQDMLLSRALNRGYGMSRYRWPMHFALLNNDSLWVMDETQLMGVGIESSAQLQGLREKLGTLENTHTWWMSATLDRNQLKTVDFENSYTNRLDSLSLNESELKHPAITQRIAAKKSLEKAPITPASGKTTDLKTYTSDLASFTLKQHRQGYLTLVIVNRVNRAQEVSEALRKLNPNISVGLVHSRFRPMDRDEQENLLRSEGDRILVATQAVEAGIDVSAATLITELAPWSSLVQRFGRCNRYGKITGGGRIFWINLQPEDTKDTRTLPYAWEDLKCALTLLNECPSASPRDLEQINYEPPSIIRPVIRRKDLLELFDTTPDLSGNDLDISRYVRDSESADVHVYWRDFDPDKEEPKADWTNPQREELCRVPFAAFAPFAKKQSAYRWNHVEERWDKINHSIVPGNTYLLPISSGGYRADLGWTGVSNDLLQQSQTISSISDPGSPDALGYDHATFTGQWISLYDHLQQVEDSITSICNHFAWATERKLTEGGFSNPPIKATPLQVLQTAARWHDVGKAHPVFQDLLKTSGTPPSDEKLWAKSEKRGSFPESWRRGFRHELVSALAYLQSTEPHNLVAWLIATHHGKVRISLRSMPNETEPPEANRLFARGIWDKDTLPKVELPSGESIGPLELDLQLIQLGDSARGPSWISRMSQLRDDPALGPFRLTLLESLLRSADARATKIETD